MSNIQCGIISLSLSLSLSLLLQANLLFFIEKILSAITASGRSCPQFMCRVFAMLRDAAVHRFPGENFTAEFVTSTMFCVIVFCLLYRQG